MSPIMRKIAVTYALTYANGSLHLGHLVGLIQTDIWVRFLKMQKIDCIYLCGCDGHGTPIMIQAEKLNLTPEQLVSKYQEEHKQDLKDFLIEVDNYHSTHSPENKILTEEIYNRHVAKGNIEKHVIKQAYDPAKQMFLPDRYIKGECPRCGAKDQYGDACEQCGATYQPTELKNAYSTLSGAPPIEKESEHYFFQLKNFTNMLRQWTRQKHLQNQVTNKLDEWFEAGLAAWDISRDAPYFGFKIPGEVNKFFYCWLDAPIGYIASFEHLKKNRSDLVFEDYWGKNSKTELYHFIGKDIMYFHTLFWPAILSGADLRTPTAVFCHGFLTVDGQKMSKSRGTFIKGRTYLDHLNPEFLRYYFATKLNDRIEDLDINFDDFMQRVNSDLIGKFVNIASRSARFINKDFNHRLSDTLIDAELFTEFVAAGDEIAVRYQNREFSLAMRQIMSLTDRINQYIDDKKPWVAIKEPSRLNEVQLICTLALNLFRLMMIYLKPVLPQIANKVEHFLNIPPLMWNDKNTPLLKHTIGDFQPLAERLDKIHLHALQAAAKKEVELIVSDKPKS